jgi:trimeric autotransporter adhesin
MMRSTGTAMRVQLSVSAFWFLLSLILSLLPLHVAKGEDSDLLQTSSPAPGIASYLGADGTLLLPDDFTGSLDPTGFELVSRANEAPRFAPKVGSGPDANWIGFGGTDNGCNRAIYAIAVGAMGDIYLGGDFTICGGTIANNVVRYDMVSNTWTALGGGLKGLGQADGTGVRALVYADGVLYAGGAFTQANVGDPIAVNYIARWDGSEWSALGSNGGNGLNNAVNALAVSNGDLYVGGAFTQANVGAPIGANYVARWDGNQWHSVGSGGGNGVGNVVLALAASGSAVYVGGRFTQVNAGAPIDANRIARWNGSEWSALGSNGGNGVANEVRALAVSGDDLYVGGYFHQVNLGAPVSFQGVGVARWNGSHWSALGDGEATISVDALAMFEGDLYAVGIAGSIRRWNGSEWSALDNSGYTGVIGPVFALGASTAGLYLGGRFTRTIGALVAATNVAKWNGSDFSALGNGGGNGVGGEVRTLAVFKGDLYVGGNFSRVGGTDANFIARWNGSEWSALGNGGGNGVNSEVLALAVSGDDLYVGGTFIRANVGAHIVANRVARWNGSEWSALGSSGGSGVNGRVSALAVSGGDLYVGGSFTQANVGAPSIPNRVPANSIARWNGSVWSALGSGGGDGVDRAVTSLAVSGSDLYVGGYFARANIGASISANHVARWNGSEWSALGSGGGNGVDDTVFALALFGSDLYVAGSFTHANVGTPIVTNHVARWNGSEWSALGSGWGIGTAPGGVRALAVVGTRLFAGGFFLEANAGAPLVFNHVAMWNGANWSALGSGTDSHVSALAPLGDYDLFVGGAFGSAGRKASSGIARYTMPRAPALDQQAYVKASNTGAGDVFGWSVAMSGDTVVIGAPGEESSATGVNGDGSDSGAPDSGAAYVFVRSGDTWSQQAYLKASNTEAGDQFGRSVAVSADTIESPRDSWRLQLLREWSHDKVQTVFPRGA